MRIRKRDLRQLTNTLNELDQISSELNLDAALHSIGYGKDFLSRVIGRDDDCVVLKRADAERLEGCLEAIRTNFLIQMNSRLVLVCDPSTTLADWDRWVRSRAYHSVGIVGLGVVRIGRVWPV